MNYCITANQNNGSLFYYLMNKNNYNSNNNWISRNSQKITFEIFDIKTSKLILSKIKQDKDFTIRNKIYNFKLTTFESI